MILKYFVGVMILSNFPLYLHVIVARFNFRYLQKYTTSIWIRFRLAHSILKQWNLFPRQTIFTSLINILARKQLLAKKKYIISYYYKLKNLENCYIYVKFFIVYHQCVWNNLLKISLALNVLRIRRLCFFFIIHDL